MTNARLEELRTKFQENPRRYFAPFANELRKAGDTAQAISVCRAHLSGQPGHVSGHIVLGQALYEAGEANEARDIFIAALELDPENLIALRSTLEAQQHTNAMRLVHGESDGLPGLVVDRYGDVLVAQFLSAGVERWREAILDALAKASGCEAIYERSDAEVRTIEGLSPRAGFVRGNRDARRCAIVEYGLNFRVDVESGQKTGFFLDQRENRQRVRALAAGRDVLDCFAYTGGFSIAALAGGAQRVLAVESSAPALEVARENLAANSLEPARVEFTQADVFAHLRLLRDRGAAFDLVVLDPPKFAPTAAQASNAARAYKDINLLALKLLRAGGLLATFSCSGGVPAPLFQSIVAGAAVDAGVEAKILERFGAAPDHPVALEFPEGEYLKGLLVLKG